MAGRYDDPHAQTGVGTPRSTADETPEDLPAADAPNAAIVTGATTSGHMSEAGAGMANRSGSGGSGGSGEGATEEEGSAGASMDELLGSEDRPAARTE